MDFGGYSLLLATKPSLRSVINLGKSFARLVQNKTRRTYCGEFYQRIGASYATPDKMCNPCLQYLHWMVFPSSGFYTAERGIFVLALSIGQADAGDKDEPEQTKHEPDDGKGDKINGQTMVKKYRCLRIYCAYMPLYEK